MTGEGTISKVVGAEAAAGWFTTALTAARGRSAVKEKDLAVTSPVAKAIVIPTITAIQRSMRCPWTAGACNLIMSIDSLHVWKCAHSNFIASGIGARVIPSTPKARSRHAYVLPHGDDSRSELIILFDDRAQIRETKI
jgi:hypothetical protein